jgi:hypothetical protein
MRIAPNASDYRRLAAASGDHQAVDANEFYTPYRRNAALLINATVQLSERPVLLMNDHVAISRPDGSVSLYVHTATRFSTAADVTRFGLVDLPQGAQLLEMKILHSDGTATAVRLDTDKRPGGLPVFSPGDAVDQEYVVNYSGDGGIAEHPEVFQFVFGRFDERVLNARFIVLTPALQADRGVVIASNNAPLMVSRVEDNMLARLWERAEVSVTTGELGLPNKSLPIVRVVDQENGWTVPSDAEHRRRIETIHPGPRFEESANRAKHGSDRARGLSRL